MKKAFFFAVITGAMFVACTKPLACIGVNKTSAAVNEELTFTNCSENTHYVDWDFGDGSTEMGYDNQVIHKYTQAGNYTVKITAHSYEDRKKPDQQEISIVIY